MIAIIGMGYVGLPLALQFARKGLEVVGIDIDPQKVDSINRGESYIKHIRGSDIVQFVASSRLKASSNVQMVAEATAVILCVPTPLNKNREPDLSFVLDTGTGIAPHLRKGGLVVLESTTYPGTTDTDLRAVLEQGSGMKAGVDFHLAFSPEREDPGNPDSDVGRIPKVVGGLTPNCLAKAQELYRQAVQTVVPVSSCRVAEATKLLENIFRSVNIALVNELKVIYDAMGIDTWEVIGAAKTKPFGFMPFYPGPGLGGHCIPIDPFYLTWKAREYGLATRFIELAGEINTGMPRYVVDRAIEALNAHCKSIKGSRILLLGLSYKADVDDIRESPTFVLMEAFDRLGASVEYYDPNVAVIPRTREHQRWEGKRSIEWNQAALKGFDAAVVATAHRDTPYAELARWVSVIVDTRNAMAGVSTCEGQLWKA